MGGDIRLLHVDDDPEFVELTAAFLEREHDGFEVTAAASASEGLEELAEGDYDCVVSDYDMPGDNGIEFLEAVREDHPDLPFVLFTGKGSEEIASEAISAGVTDYLQKGAGSGQYDLLTNRIRGAVEQYRTARELDRQNDLFAKAQRLATVGAWEHDLRTGESYVTDETLRIHGLSPGDDLPTEESIKQYHPEDRDRIREAFERAVEDGESYDIEARLIRDDGLQRWVRTRGEPQRENGEIVRLRGTLQDITEQKRREMQLERKNERLEAFAHLISHDIRNPLQVASGHLNAAKRTGDQSSFEKVEAAHERIESIVEDVLTLAKQGRKIGSTEEVDVETVAREAWETVDTADLSLNVVGDCQVEADPDRLRQLFENLFRNAAEHAGEDVTVTVGPIDPIPTSTRGARRQPNGFYVADDGSGIGEELREKVFESGFTTSEEGNGYGLAIVAQIADAHEWDASVSDSRRGGTRFEFVDRFGASL